MSIIVNTPGQGTVLIHSTTPLTPPAGRASLYIKSDNNAYILDSGGVEKQISTNPGMALIFEGNTVFGSNLSAAQGAFSNATATTNVPNINAGDLVFVALASVSSVSAAPGQIYTMEWSTTGVTLQDAPGNSRGVLNIFGNGAVTHMQGWARVAVGGTMTLSITLRNTAATAGTITINNPNCHIMVYRP